MLVKARPNAAYKSTRMSDTYQCLACSCACLWDVFATPPSPHHSPAPPTHLPHIYPLVITGSQKTIGRTVCAHRRTHEPELLWPRIDACKHKPFRWPHWPESRRPQHRSILGQSLKVDGNPLTRPLPKRRSRERSNHHKLVSESPGAPTGDL